MTRLGYLFRTCLFVTLVVVTLLVSVSVAAPTQPTAPVATLVPNDPYWQQSWSQAVLHMTEVWARTTGSSSVVIATVDSGVDASIPDLQGALVPGWDFIQNDAVPRDSVGHGTHVASVIAARGNNGIGLAGYCWGCRIMPVRVTADGSATGPEISRGIYWAVDHGARIITIGLNSGSENYDESNAVRYARDRGVLVIASAGNTGTDAPRYPAAYDGALAVAAVNDSDLLYFWSSRGSWVKLAAPGCQLVIDPAVGPGTLCGTSFTPAVVAGVAGLMLSLNPSLTVAQLVSALTSTAVPVQGISGGRINPLGALAAVAPPQQQAKPPAATPPASSGSSASGGSSKGAATAARPVTRELELSTGLLRGRLTRVVRVGAGRLDIQLRAARVKECQISLKAPNGEVFLPLLPPGEPNLRSVSRSVKAGRHLVQIDCHPNRRRTYTLSISHIVPAKVSTTATK